LHHYHQLALYKSQQGPDKICLRNTQGLVLVLVLVQATVTVLVPVTI
jgi:hypothetical protein